MEDPADEVQEKCRNSMSTSSSTSAAPAHPSDLQFEDLRADYKDAVQCLIHCESAIEDLQAQLKAKDDDITGLEEQLVEMSLELAAAKAFEDEHKAKRRFSVNFEHGNNAHFSASTSTDLSASFMTITSHHEHECPSSPTPGKNVKIECPYSPAKNNDCQRSKSMPLGTVDPPSPRGRQNRRRSWWGGNRRGSQENEGHRPALDESNKTCGSSFSDSLDESACSRRGLGIGALFRKNSNRRCDNLGEENAKAVVTEVTQVEDKPHDEPPKRRAPNRSRPGIMKQPSQRSSLMGSNSGLVFPSSFESIVLRGCMEVTGSLTSSMKGLSYPERRMIEHGSFVKK
eukprot:CAMPEP_0183757208 /NCGR_PEP_ID=MMETSP0739-20130205/5579_1 /TAXON_ID=385413 /ORGANISM="Thalassiosira miniscula, Strain CCMP1093" /LENGTH=341 /DNA_ID=CAMNT_0025994589 /DNA_START=301 /DNA_END=1329 /DNA_ORIENTATION=+